MMAPHIDPSIFSGKAAEAAAFLRSMANEHRLMILCRLGRQEMSVGELQAETALSQSALSQHLAVLREEGLVKTRRQSQSIFYSVADPAVVRMIATLAAIFCPDMLDDPAPGKAPAECVNVNAYLLEDRVRAAPCPPKPWRRPVTRSGQ